MLGSLLAPTTDMSAEDRLARENLVTSLVAGIAAASGTNAATATGAGQIEGENNQFSAVAPSSAPPPWLQGLLKLPGYTGETASKGDGVIADPATSLDPTIKGGTPPTTASGSDLIKQIFDAPVVDVAKGLVSDILTASGGNNAKDSLGAAPPNLSPDGAGRSGAFNEAKRASGVPVSQQPSAVLPNTDKRGNPQPGYIYVYEIPLEGGGSKTVEIQDDASGHFFGEGDPQNRGSHFNDQIGNHYDY